MNVIDQIKFNDTVTIKNRFGQLQKGKARIHNRAHNVWVLNMGGKVGTPGIATAQNIVSINGKKVQEQQVNEFGDKLFGTKYVVWYKDSPEDKQMKKTQLRAKSMVDAAKRALGIGANKFIYRVELAEGTFKIVESDLPDNVRITPLATQRKWEDLTSKVAKVNGDSDKMMYNHDLFIGVDKQKDGTNDLIYGYPLVKPPAMAIQISPKDFDAILKDPVRWLIERFGVESAHSYLQRVKSKSFWENPTIRNIFSRVTREIAEDHGVSVVEEGGYSYDKIKKDSNSWYNKPEMLGHRWAKETLDSVERIVNKYGSSNWQKYIIANVFDFNLSGDRSWNTFVNGLSKKYLSHIQYVLRNGGSKTPIQLLMWRVSKGGYVKDTLDWVLEYAAYKHDPEKYTQWYSKMMGFYGLPKDEAAHRLAKYISNQIAPKIKNKELA